MKTPIPDSILLPRLAARMNVRPNRVSRTALAKKFHRPGSRWWRSPLSVASRYLRRFAGGEWHRGGHHLGRPDFGPALCEQHGKWYADRLPASVEAE